MRIRTGFPYDTVHEDVRIPLADRTRLYARVWRPLTDESVPAVAEYSPGRLTDWTAPRDWQRHPWYAGHGYASVRVDVRGHGNSEGVPGDVHDVDNDGVEVVNWLARQPWCTGQVGMFGISRGALLALRVAALAPAPLKAIVTVCPPYGMGGAVLAEGAHSRTAALLAYAVRPPDPLYVGDAWRGLWLTRLEAVEPAIEEYAVVEEYEAIGAAVLAVGGWHEPHRDAVLRLAERLPPDRVRGVIGPWSHQYPDRGLPPGPAIGFLQETLRWWDHHLKGVGNDVMAEPLLRSWISESHPPAIGRAKLPGRWVGDATWPSGHVTLVPYPLQGAPVIVDSPQHTGLDAGRFRPCGNDADLPPDQRAEDAHSACFDFPVMGGEPVEILGRPRVTLRLRQDAPYGQAVARLCDVAPDGASTLVTRGVLDLAAAQVHELAAIGHAFLPGHRIRLAVSSAYWPWIWPRTGAAETGFTLDPAGSRLELPVRHPGGDMTRTSFEAPEQSDPLGVVVPVTLDEPRPERLVIRDVAKGEWRLEADPRPGPAIRLYPDGLELTEDALETYTVQEDDPSSAHARSRWTIRLHRPELPWDARIETRSEISRDPTGLRTLDEVVCRDGDEVVFHRTWENRIPHTGG